MTILLEGIVGSTAYGLATADSDVDLLGVYAWPTRELFKLHQGNETRTGTNPDFTYHEVRKYCKLALKCNPTVLELMWLSEYTQQHSLGKGLINIRSSFLYESGVRNAYLGYATQQFRRLKDRGDGSFSSDTRKRTAKHARHLWRLCHQGRSLHSTGELKINLGSFLAGECHSFGDRVANGDLGLASGVIGFTEETFNIPGVLPEQPDRDMVEAWLIAVREVYLH